MFSSFSRLTRGEKFSFAQLVDKGNPLLLMTFGLIFPLNPFCWVLSVSLFDVEEGKWEFCTIEIAKRRDEMKQRSKRYLKEECCATCRRHYSMEFCHANNGCCWREEGWKINYNVNPPELSSGGKFLFLGRKWLYERVRCWMSVFASVKSPCPPLETFSFRTFNFKVI